MTGGHFSCRVATDLYGKKHNVRFNFEATPTMDTLTNHVESHFDVAARSTRPAGYPDIPFKVHTFQIFDTVLLRWVELYATAQLSHNAQLYAFQPENPWHTDMQGRIRSASPVVNWCDQYGQPRRPRVGRHGRDSGQAPSQEEKLQSVFNDLDINSKDYLLLADITGAMDKLNIVVAEGEMEALFRRAIRNHRSRSGHMTYEEWVTFGRDHPNIVDALFFRARPVWNDHTAKVAAHEELLAMRRQRERELKEVQKRRNAWLQRSTLERQLERQRKESSLARLQAEIATIREHARLDDLYYTNTKGQRANKGGI